MAERAWPCGSKMLMKRALESAHQYALHLRVGADSYRGTAMKRLTAAVLGALLALAISIGVTATTASAGSPHKAPFLSWSQGNGGLHYFCLTGARPYWSGISDSFAVVQRTNSGNVQAIVQLRGVPNTSYEVVLQQKISGTTQCGPSTTETVTTNEVGIATLRIVAEEAAGAYGAFVYYSDPASGLTATELLPLS